MLAKVKIPAELFIPKRERPNGRINATINALSNTEAFDKKQKAQLMESYDHLEIAGHYWSTSKVFMDSFDKSWYVDAYRRDYTSTSNKIQIT